MGEVYRAKDARLGRDVALKILPPPSLQIQIASFVLNKKLTLHPLNHPAIITIYDVGFAEKKADIAMEFVDGKNLHEIIRAGAPPSPICSEARIQASCDRRQNLNC